MSSTPTTLVSADGAGAGPLGGPTTEKSPNTPKRLPLHLNTRTLTSHLFYGPYIYIPLICSFVWLGGILAMLGLWVRDGKPRYRDDLPSVVFISHVGAVYHTLFIAIASVTGAFFILSMFAERWLRHVDRLPADLRKREKVFDWLAIAFAIIASVGLILCSILDAFNHGSIHWAMALVFIAGTALSAIFQSAEIWSLHKDHPDRRSLLRNSVIKLVVITIAVAGAIGFGVTYGLCGGDPYSHGSRSAEQCNRISSACAALEWTIAFVLFFYFLTLVADLWPAGKSSPRYMRRLARWEEKHGVAPGPAATSGSRLASGSATPAAAGAGALGPDTDFTGRGAFDAHPERWMTAEQRAEAMQREMRARNRGEVLDPTGESVGARYEGRGESVRPEEAGRFAHTQPLEQERARGQGYAEEELRPSMDVEAGGYEGYEGAPRPSQGSGAPMMRNL